MVMTAAMDDDVLVDNMEEDLSVWEHTEDEDEVMDDVSQVSGVTDASSNTRRSSYHTSHVHYPSNNRETSSQ